MKLKWMTRSLFSVVHRRQARAGLLLIALLALLAGCGAITVTGGSPLDQLAPPPGSAPSGGPAAAYAPQPTVPAYNNNAPLLQPTGNIEVDIRAVVDRVKPAVAFVGIQASLQNFSQPVPVGNGSGAIIDAQGHIVTNNHVVESAQSLKVTLPDGRTFDAQVVGRDPASDLAVIQIQGDNLPVLPMGDSGQLHVGDWVIAIGNALGLKGGPTVTKGVISAMSRTIEEENGAAIPNLIQTDAAINPGNSGGPLVNLNGQLVGINTAVPGPTGQGFQPFGIGFAIAINEAKPIIDQLIGQGHVVRPYLGVASVSITPAIQAQANLPVDHGVVITSVGQGSPASSAGLKPGDVIAAVDGKAIEDEAGLRQAIQAHKIGDTIQLTLLRGQQQLTVSAKLAQAPTP